MDKHQSHTVIQRALVEFLLADLDLSHTFLDTAEMAYSEIHLDTPGRLWKRLNAP